MILRVLFFLCLPQWGCSFTTSPSFVRVRSIQGHRRMHNHHPHHEEAEQKQAAPGILSKNCDRWMKLINVVKARSNPVKLIMILPAHRNRELWWGMHCKSCIKKYWLCQKSVTLCWKQAKIRMTFRLIANNMSDRVWPEKNARTFDLPRSWWNASFVPYWAIVFPFIIVGQT